MTLTLTLNPIPKEGALREALENAKEKARLAKRAKEEAARTAAAAEAAARVAAAAKVAAEAAEKERLAREAGEARLRAEAEAAEAAAAEEAARVAAAVEAAQAAAEDEAKAKPVVMKWQSAPQRRASSEAHQAALASKVKAKGQRTPMPMPSQAQAPSPNATDAGASGVCMNYRVDMTASSFGQCVCGRAKSDHPPEAFSRGKRRAGGSSTRESSLPPTEVPKDSLALRHQVVAFQL